MEGPVVQAKQFADMGKQRFLKTFGFVPDEKLTYQPSPSAKSALRIAAHVGVSNGAFARIIRGEPFPQIPLDEMFAMMEKAETAIKSREEAVALIESSHAEVLAALDGLGPEQVASMVTTPFITAPMPFFMNLPGLHLQNHAAQVDYIQTIWGDQDPHF